MTGPADPSGRRTLLRLDRVTVRYGIRPVLRNVSLRLRSGEVVGLVGGNGAGKTTLLRTAAGLVLPAEGEVALQGIPLRDLDPADRDRIGFLGDHPLLYPELTAVENLSFVTDLAGLQVRRRDLVAAVDRVGLAGREDDRVSTFSRGMAQRLAIARAVLLEPEVLLLDEPLAALDDSGRAVLIEEIVAHRRAGGATLLAFHDLAAGLPLCDRILILARGRIVRRIAGPTAAVVTDALREAGKAGAMAAGGSPA